MRDGVWKRGVDTVPTGASESVSMESIAGITSRHSAVRMIVCDFFQVEGLQFGVTIGVEVVCAVVYCVDLRAGVRLRI